MYNSIGTAKLKHHILNNKKLNVNIVGKFYNLNLLNYNEIWKAQKKRAVE